MILDISIAQFRRGSLSWEDDGQRCYWRFDDSGVRNHCGTNTQAGQVIGGPAWRETRACLSLNIGLSLTAS